MRYINKQPKPTILCFCCGLNDWWFREPNDWGRGDWLCSKCHPNPNKEENMKEEIELINGKFVKKKKEETKISREEPKISREEHKPKQYSEDVIALRDRVITGNRKLYEAWLKIRELAHDTEEWSKQMDRWNEAQVKLRNLCIELKTKGYRDCLYLNSNNKRTKNCLENPDGSWCHACPSTYPYWEEDASKTIFKEE